MFDPRRHFLRRLPSSRPSRRRSIRRPGFFALVLALPLLLAPACSNENGHRGTAPLEGVVDGRPVEQVFWDHWSDNRGELSAYRLVTPRYGELREGTLVWVYVLEQMDRRNWIKDDQGSVPQEHQTIVMKLNETMRFLTGIYPYSVMTSVFSPVGPWHRERFSPTRITLTAQEWCGQVYLRVMPRRDHFGVDIRSYFSSEGEDAYDVASGDDVLFENALPIQLRELDGPFAGGGDWEGRIVPALWQQRISHEPLATVPATISRSTVTGENGQGVSRFILAYGDYRRSFDVEQESPRRILGWTTSEGERATLLGTQRLTYWQLNGLGDERHLEALGLDVRTGLARLPAGAEGDLDDPPPADGGLSDPADGAAAD